jgi:RNA 3'-terminal phosphate cyclase
MGINIDYKVLKGGYFPKGNGQVQITTQPLSKAIQPINFTGKKSKIHTVYLNLITKNDTDYTFGDDLRDYLKSKFKRLMRKG